MLWLLSIHEKTEIIVMKLTVLGKYGSYPRTKGGTSSYLLRSAKAAVALDFGSGALSRISAYTDVCDLDGIILSHLHNDHICDLFPLVYLLEAKKTTLNLYLPFTECPQYDFVSSFNCFDLIPIVEGRKIRLGDIEFVFNKMTHPIESYSVRAADGKTVFFYSGDTTFNDRILSCANGAGTLLLDCCALSGSPAHMTVEQGAFIGRSLSAKVLATHVLPTVFAEHSAKAAGIEIVEEFATYEV